VVTSGRWNTFYADIYPAVNGLPHAVDTDACSQAAVSVILDSLDDIGCIVDGVATTDVEFLQYILQDHRLHSLLEVSRYPFYICAYVVTGMS
jgi:hypothetical protein